VEGPTTWVVVIAVLVEGEDVIVLKSALEGEIEAPGVVCALCGDVLVLFFDRLPPTPPPTAAPITTIAMIAATMKNVFEARPHIRLPLGEAPTLSFASL